MAASTIKSDYFGTFLGTALGMTDAEMPPSAASASIQKDLLNTLSREDKPVSIAELIKQMEAPPSAIVHALRELAQANLLTMHDEVASVTDLGRRLVF